MPSRNLPGWREPLPGHVPPTPNAGLLPKPRQRSNPCIKAQLAEARARYHELTNAFVDELKGRCAVMSEDEECALVLELLAQDVQAGLDAAVGEKRQELVRFVEGLWNKYAVPLSSIIKQRQQVVSLLDEAIKDLGYVR